MPLLFSYGTLQDERVQLRTFGRRLVTQRDELPEYEEVTVCIDDPASAAELGETHMSVAFNGRPASSVKGVVLDLTDVELEAADAYERPAGYTRQLATLASGRRAWVYAKDEAEIRPVSSRDDAR